jgi:hypothetical protein
MLAFLCVLSCFLLKHQISSVNASSFLLCMYLFILLRQRLLHSGSSRRMGFTVERQTFSLRCELQSMHTQLHASGQPPPKVTKKNANTLKSVHAKLLQKNCNNNLT